MFTQRNRRIGWILAMVLLACLAVGDRASADNLRQLSPQERKHFLAVKHAAAARPGVPLTLNFADDSHRRFVMRQFREAGMFRRFNGRDLDDAVDAMKEHHRSKASRQDLTLLQMKPTYGTWHPSVMITQLTPMPDGSYYAAAQAAIPKALHMILFLQLFDNRTWQRIGEISVVDEWLDPLVSISATGRSPSPNVTAVFTCFYHTRRDEHPTAQVLFKSLGRVADPTFSGLKPCKLNDATCANGQVTSGSGTKTKICLDRTPDQQADCDQSFVGIGDQTHRYLDIEGTVTVDDPLAADWLPQQVDLYITNNDGTCKVDGAQVVNFTKTASDQFFWTEQESYSKDCLDSSGLSHYHMGFSVTTTAGPQSITINGNDTCTPNTNAGQACIYPLHFVWGCLAEGTPILMADGSLRRVEAIEVGEKVLADADGRVLTVVNTYVGTEDTEEKPLVVVEDDRGHRLGMSETHPTKTARGILLAKQLVVGDVVTTREGSAKLVKVERPQPEGKVKVYNLDLGAEGEGVTEDDTTLFAGGILVGDNQMQGTYEERFRTGAHEEIPAAWRRDYKRWAEKKEEKEGGRR